MKKPDYRYEKPLDKDLRIVALAQAIIYANDRLPKNNLIFEPDVTYVEILAERFYRFLMGVKNG